jgi:DNA-binding GntR family transcriptional regulator
MSRTGRTTETGGVVGHPTARQAVVERLRSSVVGGSLKPGTRLLQSELAKDLGVSTTPVREALAQLATEGLLDLDPHRGFVVHEPTREEFEQIHAMRMALEPLGIAWAVERITQEELDRLDAVIDEMEGADNARYVDLNSVLHELLADASGSKRLASILRSLKNISMFYVARSLRGDPDRLIVREGVEQHRRLVRAFRDRDVVQAQAIDVEHLAHALEAGLGYLASEGW